MAGIYDVADRIWPVLNRAIKLHTLVYRLSGGRIGQRGPGLPQTLLLDHVGAKSGTKRTSPLVYAHDGENIILIASKGGHPQNPAWYHNLVANPDTTVQIGAERRAVRARVAEGDERERLWRIAVELNPVFGEYQERTERRIPVLVLEPR